MVFLTRVAYDSVSLSSDVDRKRQLAKVNIDHILIGDCVIRPKGVVKNLGTRL